MGSLVQRAAGIAAVVACLAIPSGALDVTATFLDGSTGFGAQLAISGDGRRVVFESSSDLTGQNADGNNELFLWSEAGGFVQLTSTTGTSFYWDVDVDATGDHVAMVARADVTGAGAARTELYRWTNGLGWQRLTTTAGTVDQVFIDRMGISGDGSRIAFSSRGDHAGANPGGEMQVFLWSAAGGFEQVTTASPCGSGGGNFAIDLSGDGRRILLSSRCRIGGGNADLLGDLYLWDESTGFQALTAETEIEVGALATLDADGSAAALTSGQDLVNGGYGDATHLFRWRDGQGFEQLSSQGVAHDRPAIDADGSRIAYTAANGQGLGGNPEGANEVFLWDAGAFHALTESTQDDDFYGNERPVLDGAGGRVALVAFRAFAAPDDPRTGYFVLDVPEPGATALSLAGLAALGVRAHSRSRTRAHAASGSRPSAAPPRATG